MITLSKASSTLFASSSHQPKCLENCSAGAGQTSRIFWRESRCSDSDLIASTCSAFSRDEIESWFRWQSRGSRNIYLFFSRQEPPKLIAICAIDFMDEEGMDLNIASRTTSTGSLKTLYIDQDYNTAENTDEVWSILYNEARTSGLQNLTVRAETGSVNDNMANALQFEPQNFSTDSQSPSHVHIFKHSL
ncbi:hypothetical protein H4219_000891 [Mycoemilia scoparia]|uniref:Uncharacterized protein n=1 Tax=Mycoemilia scoparia TaxID=417184 RepID=A0A9W8A1L9_9FUNG|nr:hypothetical protein H4219_000891 [Mycoemilia scoparia]